MQKYSFQNYTFAKASAWPPRRHHGWLPLLVPFQG
jgi:hypothetical protein